MADTTKPTLVVSHNAASTPANAAFDFIFTFSESVGSSFTLSDINLSGLVASAIASELIQVSETVYKLRITPPNNSTGRVNLNMSASAFQDLANNSNADPVVAWVDFNTITTTAGWTLDWSEEFNGSALDTSVWNYDSGNSATGGWGNNELQYYQAANASVQGGVLTITAKQESGGGMSYTSARLQTSRKKTFTFGRFEMRAKLPQGQGMWPAFWLLGASCNSFNLYGGNINWPNCGEIDIMEMVGGLDVADRGDYSTHGTLHYSDAQGINPMPTGYKRHTEKLSSAFNIYTLDWTANGFVWYLNGVEFTRQTMASDMTALNNKPFFLLLNLAVGGGWPGSPNNTTVFPQIFQIDYIRYYKQGR
jgi:beta-glucanase (GH16 family)